jgi:hypothetical protein
MQFIAGDTPPDQYLPPFLAKLGQGPFDAQAIPCAPGLLAIPDYKAFLVEPQTDRGAVERVPWCGIDHTDSVGGGGRALTLPDRSPTIPSVPRQTSWRRPAPGAPAAC